EIPEPAPSMVPAFPQFGKANPPSKDQISRTLAKQGPHANMWSLAKEAAGHTTGEFYQTTRWPASLLPVVSGQIFKTKTETFP
ncbi:MAG: hypothetical protein ACPGYL_15900, partial [Rhodospirillaceae bacterium]